MEGGRGGSRGKRKTEEKARGTKVSKGRGGFKKTFQVLNENLLR
jgi:hypothetical protein